MSREPLSIERLVQRQKAEKEANAKVMSKAIAGHAFPYALCLVAEISLQGGTS